MILQIPENATTLLEAQLSNEDPLFKFYWARCQKAQKIGDLVILCGFIQKFLLKSLQDWFIFVFKLRLYKFRVLPRFYHYLTIILRPKELGSHFSYLLK